MLAKPVKEQMGDNFKLNKSHQMQIFVRLHGFKELSKAVFAINTEPSDTISSIARKLQEIAGVPADRLTMLSGLALNNPSGSFKKLDGSGTVADQGLCHGSTVMAFVPVGQHDSSDALVAPPSQCKRRSICVGKVHYKPSPSQPLKSGDIMAVTGDVVGKSSTTLMFEGVEYANAQEWLAKVFNNSGKSCAVQFERSQAVHTPRPTRYVPPTEQCPFGRYM